MAFPSRLLSFALMLAAFGSMAHAQQQEEKLVDRLKRGPNSNLTYNTSQSAFGTRPVSAVTTGKVARPGAGEFNTKAFLSREFNGKPYGGAEKRSWFAKLFFPGAKNASTTGKYEIPNAGQAYATKEAPTKESHAAEKTASTNAYAATDLQYLKRDRFDTSIKAAPPQDKIVGWTGDGMRPMSIDDVRELLNKNK